MDPRHGDKPWQAADLKGPVTDRGEAVVLKARVGAERHIRETGDVGDAGRLAHQPLPPL